MKTIGPPRWRTILTAILFLITIFPFVWWGLLRLWYNGSIFPPETAPAERVAVVFGARVFPSGRLSGMLRDRVDTAVQLYHAGAVQKLLLSGDNRFEDYNEPQAMMAYAIARGVPAEDIQPDYGGRRTYDTCYRAREIFQLESALLITQNFHLPRALFTCQRLGLAVTAVAADRNRYSRRSLAWSTAREIPATLVALLDTIHQRPAPVLGEPISID
jgi:SanA protein